LRRNAVLVIREDLCDVDLYLTIQYIVDEFLRTSRNKSVRDECTLKVTGIAAHTMAGGVFHGSDPRSLREIYQKVSLGL
jgi:hypothetical protein